MYSRAPIVVRLPHLVFGIWSLAGVWSLVFGVCPTSPSTHVKGAKKKKCPPVPRQGAAEKRGKRGGEVLAGRPAPIAAQWNVNVVAQEAGERDMPAPPEVRDVRRLVG